MHIWRTYLGLVVNNIMHTTEGKQCATKEKETEGQLWKSDYEESLLTDIKSKIESI